jgi:uncharacterized protein
MNQAERVIFDTNTLVSTALFPGSVPGQALTVASQTYEILASSETLIELEAVLSRSKFERYLSLEKRQNFLAYIRLLVILVETNETITACRDPKDNKFLELAVSGKATALITGDKDLLDLHPFREIPILTPRDFLNLHQSEDS